MKENTKKKQRRLYITANKKKNVVNERPSGETHTPNGEIKVYQYQASSRVTI